VNEGEVDAEHQHSGEEKKPEHFGMNEFSDVLSEEHADEWRPLFATADCCVTIMATLEEALRDPHFVERGLFAHRVAGPTGATMPALPVPIDPQFRDDAGAVKVVPKLGGDKL